MSTKPAPTEQTVSTVIKLSSSQLTALERKLPAPDVSSTTSPQEVGYKLGIQKVLQVLRDGFSYNN